LPQLTDGIGFVVVAMGLFGFSEIIANLERRAKREVVMAKITSLFPTRMTSKHRGKQYCAAPESGLSWVYCRVRRYTGIVRCICAGEKSGQGSDALRKGAIEGVAGPESANNAGAQTSFIPLLTLGHPDKRGNGTDDRRDDHSRHYPRPAGDDRTP